MATRGEVWFSNIELDEDCEREMYGLGDLVVEIFVDRLRVVIRRNIFRKAEIIC